MILSISKNKLLEYLLSQLNHFFPDDYKISISDIINSHNLALDRIEYCFSHVVCKYFHKNGETYFNHLHSDQYSMYLYFLSNSLFGNYGREDICGKIFYLNKSLHGIDCFYSIRLPKTFLFLHPLGTVLGNAQYSNFFLVSQNCVVGDNFDGKYPVIGEGVALYSGAALIGNCKIGDNCEIAANSLVHKMELSKNNIYVGTPNNYKLRFNNHSVIKKHFIK